MKIAYYKLYSVIWDRRILIGTRRTVEDAREYMTNMAGVECVPVFVRKGV